MAKSYLVTGVAGFIGSHLAEALLKKGHRVVGMDNLDPTYAVSKKQFNLEQVQKAAGGKNRFEFLKVDLRDREKIQGLFEKGPFGAILHLGALAGVQASLTHPEEVFRVNLTGTLHLLDAAVKNRCRNFLLASSSSVYGANPTPWRESDRTARPLSPYAASKGAAELLAHSYHYLYGFNVACLRFFTVYGARQRPDLALYKFARAMLKGETITLFGEGKASRDFTFIEDCLRGTLKAIDWCEATDQPRLDIFNLGESQTVTLGEVVEHLEKNLGVKAKIELAPLPAGDVMGSLADLAHSKEVLGYAPQVKFAEGIRRFCEWYLKEEKDKPWA